MESKTDFIEKYKELKKLNNGRKPLCSDYLKFCKIHKRKLESVFGSDSYTKLQQECGDIPNKLTMERTPLKQIFNQYGLLVRKNNSLPVGADWIHAKFKPTPDALNKVHNLKWTEMPQAFFKEYEGEFEWKDVVTIIKEKLNKKTFPKKNRTFDEILEKIITWNPDRKRIIEEGYKIELRNYLENFFKLEEEVGESNPDLLINGKYPIEIKKDPSQSEYDRLLGQMIRHNKLYGSAIAIVTSISSEDRFKKNQKLFMEVHDKLEMKAELINK